MKYNIEGNIDFFAELYKSLDDEDNQNKTAEDDNLCLITNQPLTEKYVELNCSHKFNYIPLYNDIYNHKKKYNNMEGSISSLKVNEIRCPYCRKKQVGVLPYYSELITTKTNGVNFYDDTILQNSNKTNTYCFGKCEFIVSQSTNVSCTSTYVTKSACDNKTYCYYHNKNIIKKFEKEKKEKEKEAQKKSKEEAKQKAKEEKNKIKEAKKNEKITKKTLNQINNLYINIIDIEDENIVISSLTQSQISNEGCVQIIKTGLNKGNPCGLSILNDCLCKRHYNLKNKNIII